MVKFRASQKKVAAIYDEVPAQYYVAVLIFANFIANIVQAQIDPRGTKYADTFLAIEDAFNILFLVELLINLYCHWFRKFWTAWSVFDLLVVVVGMISVARVHLPGPFGLLRMLRAFRVFRLFKRIESLKRIMVSLVRAIPGILNSALIMVLVMCIYAILGVQFFGRFGLSGTYVNSNNITCSATTARDLKHGDEYFGTFSASLLTNFQVLTGESWSEIIARPILAVGIVEKVGGAIYFVSFIIINAMILFNVVVAVLLDKCMNQDGDSTTEPDTEGEPEPPEKRLKQAGEAFESPPSREVRRDLSMKSLTIVSLKHDKAMGVLPLASPPQRGLVAGPGCGMSGYRGADYGATTHALRPVEISFAKQSAAPSDMADEAMLSGLCVSMSMLNKQMAIILAAVSDNQMQLDSLDQAVSPSTPSSKIGLLNRS